MSSIFGEFFLPSTLVVQSKKLLERWFPEYLEEIEDKLGLPSDTLAIPKNYTQRNEFTSLAGEELPKCVVLSPGIAGPPQKDGRGVYRGTWRLGIGVAVAAPTEEEADTLAQIYGACVRVIFVNHPSINGVASNTVYVDENYNELPITGQNQQFRSASVWFAVEIDNVAKRSAGPQDPANVFGIAEEVIIQNDRLT